MLLAQLVVEYIADTSKLVSSVANVKNAAEEGAASLRNMATAGAEIATAALIGVGVASTKMAGDFQQSMTKLTTTAGESKNAIGMVSQGVLDMASQVGTSAQTLGDAMYWIESGGAHGAAGLNDLKIAAMGAKAENANLDDVAKALMFTLNNYAGTGLTAAQAMNTLIAGVGNGEMSFQDLSTAVSNVMPTAKTFGISLTDVVAGLDAMTQKGDDASSAATHLAMMIKTLEAPSTAGSKALASIGLSTQQVTDEMRKSLPDALDLIITKLKDKFPEGSTAYNEALKNISGGSRSMQAIMETTGTSMDVFRQDVNNINSAVKQGGDSIAGWSDVQQNFNFKMDQAKATLEVLGISIGQKLLPVLGKALDAFNSPAFQQFATTVAGALTTALLGLINGISTLVGWVTQLVTYFQHNQAAAMALEVGVAILAGAILGALVVAFAMGAAAAAETAIAFLSVAWPVILIVAAIAGLGVGLFLLYQRFAPVREVVNAVGQTFKMLWGVIMEAFMPAWVELQGALNNAIPMFQFLGVVLLGTIVVAIGVVIAAIEGLAVGIGFAVTGIVNIITGFVDLFNGVFQVLAGIIFFFKDLFTGNFSQLGADLGLIWRGIINIFVGAWDIIKGIFVTVGGFLVGFVGGFIVGIVQFFQHLYDTLVGHSIIPDMVNGIINWFLQLPGRVGAAIQSMISSVMSMLNGWLTSLFQFGANIVNNIANGIKSAIGAVTGAITSVTQAIANFLPHSPAKVGPLMDLEQTGTEISNQISKGMINGTPLINSALGNLTKPISVGLKGVASASSTTLQGGQQGDTYIQITLDGKDITNSTMKRVQKELRGHGLKK